MSHPRRLTTSRRELEDFLNISLRMVNSPLFTSSKRGFCEHNTSTLLLVKSLNSHSEQRRRRTNDRADDDLKLTIESTTSERTQQTTTESNSTHKLNVFNCSAALDSLWSDFCFWEMTSLLVVLFFSSSVKCLLCLCSDLHVTSPLWKWSRMDDEARREKTSDSAHGEKWRIYSYFFSIDITSNDRENGHPCRKMCLS